MVNPYIDMWDDNNITLGWDIGDGRLLTQGGDYRYVENPEQRSVVFLGPTKLLQGREPSTDNRKVEKPENLQATDPLANINVPQKPPVPSWFNAPQPEQNLRQAEEELNQAKVEDAQYGSDGYENKENGVFNRIKNWGSSVGDYLFGKDKTTAETQVPLTSDAIKNASLNAAARQAIDSLNDRAEEQAKEEQGILGYYGNKILGKQGRQEWEDFKKDWQDRGLGALTGRASNLMETMARSPYANMVDPTTVLGGQRTMVNDIDSYFNQRGLGALRNDLLKQDLVDRQTLLGQAERYAAKPPEEQAAIDRYMQNRRAGAASTFNIKNEENARMAAREDFKNEFGRYPNEEEAEALYRDLGISKKPTNVPRNINQALLNEADRRYNEDPVAYDYNPMNAYREVYGEASNDPNIQGQLQRSGSYQPKTAKEKIQQKQAETLSSEYAKNVAKEASGFGKDFDTTLQGLESLREILLRPETKDMFGGVLNSRIKSIAAELGYSGTDEQQALAVFNSVMRSMHGEAARQIDPSGRLTDAEQRRIDSTIIDLDKPVAYNLKMVEDTISRMATAKAINAEEYDMVYNGLSPREVSQAIDSKYYYIRRNPQMYVSPKILETYKYRNGQFLWSNKVNGWVFQEERQ